MKHSLQQTYRVHVFLGDFDPSTRTWHTAQNLVGTFVVLGKNPGTTGCGKCKDDSEKQVAVTGTIPLTAALIQAVKDGQLGGLEKEQVIPWLTKELHWRVTLVSHLLFCLVLSIRTNEIPFIRLSISIRKDIQCEVNQEWNADTASTCRLTGRTNPVKKFPD